jgi:hypothetical protein
MALAAEVWPALLDQPPRTEDVGCLLLFLLRHAAAERAIRMVERLLGVIPRTFPFARSKKPTTKRR